MLLSFYAKEFVIIFVFGLCIGSFLNCLIYRLEPRKSIARGRSFCPKCRHKLGVLDLVPVLSFFLLRAKCRYCKKKISWQYPIVEIATGLLFVLLLWYSIVNFADTFGFIYFWLSYLWAVFALLIVIFVYDLKHYIIPDKVIYLLIAIVSLPGLIELSSTGGLKYFKVELLSALCAALFFFIIWLVSKGKWMGFGDVKLAFFMGLFLGWPNIAVALFSAFIIGSLAGLVLISLGRKKFKSEVPFGPFLIIGTFVALFWGKEIVGWYLNLAT